MTCRIKRPSSRGARGLRSLRRESSPFLRVLRDHHYHDKARLSHARAGFDTFLPFNTPNFVTAYIGLPIFFVLWVGYKVFMRTKVIPSEKVDLITGQREIEQEEAKFNADEEAKGPRSFWVKVWDGL
jgi:hypothetical protein